MSYNGALYIGMPDPEKKDLPTMERADTQQTLAERRGNTWYKKFSLNLKNRGKSISSSMISTSTSPPSPAKGIQEYLNNKPLPPTPMPTPQLSPYFEYMFADAGMKKKKSDESMSSSRETDSIEGKSSFFISSIFVHTIFLQNPKPKRQSLAQCLPPLPVAQFKATA